MRNWRRSEFRWVNRRPAPAASPTSPHILPLPPFARGLYQYPFPPMKLPLLLAPCTFGSLLALAADPSQPRKANASPAGLYVPVSLDAHANDRAGAGLSDPHPAITN